MSKPDTHLRSNQPSLRHNWWQPETSLSTYYGQYNQSVKNWIQTVDLYNIM